MLYLIPVVLVFILTRMGITQSKSAVMFCVSSVCTGVYASLCVYDSVYLYMCVILRAT